ncbi:hypothetical protein DAKH74_018080 [Maudiozyma humilis]|uniref:non-specific serine/threonine protein kinase n=1 Tax=Maudiozyma humilis TaxID=51915 RepID=A0AAV5RWT6_MAUHU|nr:hypothetical protein DAKH74_018080 [Kazachstania humilis]
MPTVLNTHFMHRGMPADPPAYTAREQRSASSYSHPGIYVRHTGETYSATPRAAPDVVCTAIAVEETRDESPRGESPLSREASPGSDTPQNWQLPQRFEGTAAAPAAPVAPPARRKSLPALLSRLFRRKSQSRADNTAGVAPPPLGGKYAYTGLPLGRGAGGTVTTVRRVRDGALFAVKQFHAPARGGDNATEECDQASHARRVHAEYCISSVLQHRNVITTLEILEEPDGALVQVMEYAHYDLFNIVRSGRMHYAEACCYFKQLCQGVAYLHALGVCHRDIKLDNLVVSDRGTLKIVDFGAAVRDGPGASMASGIVGSDPYLAPELFLYREYDARAADVWSAGIVFACMVLGRFPWRQPRLCDASFSRFCAAREPEGKRAPPTLRDLVERPAGAPLDPLDGPGTQIDSDGRPRGPLFLLGELPEECQPLLLRVLDPSPVRRPAAAEMLREPWVAALDECSRNSDAQRHPHVVLPEGHRHIADLPLREQSG